MTANSFCVFFLLKLTRAVRWGKNSGTRTRMILREMEVSVGTQTNCRSSLLYLFIYTFSGFSLSASRHVTSFSHSILLSSILVNRTYGSRPETRGISLHRTFFFWRSVKSHCGSWFRAYTFVSIRFVGSVPDLKFLSRRKTKHRNN